jgi:hypothetical protein
VAAGENLAGLALRNKVERSPEYLAAKALAEHAGLEISVARVLRGPPDPRPRGQVTLDRLAADWRGVFSPDGRPYRTLNKTLMNLPGGIPAALLGCLCDVRLERPVTDRVELLALLGCYAHAVRHEPARQHWRLFLHVRRPDFITAMRMVSGATHTPLSPRRSTDIRMAAGFLADFPGAHRVQKLGTEDR